MDMQFNISLIVPKREKKKMVLYQVDVCLEFIIHNAKSYI